MSQPAVAQAVAPPPRPAVRAAPGIGTGTAPPRKLTRRVELPRSRRRYGFSMTAMADMMFQLLVFFMLSTNVMPYSLLDVAAGRLAGGTGFTAPPQTADPVPPGPATDIRQTAVWTLRADGAIVAGGQDFDRARLPELAEALVAQRTPGLLVVLGPGVTVQGIVSVLEILAARGVPGVRVVGGAAP